MAKDELNNDDKSGIISNSNLLRNPKCISKLKSFSEGCFLPIIDDKISSKKIKKIVLCSGKIFYELLERREKDKIENIAFIRIEQLFPLDKKQIINLVKKYKSNQIFWVQEEPENMGAWRYILSHLKNLNIKLISRKSSPAPASGSSKSFADQQKIIIDSVFK